MATFRYVHVDVFTDTALAGNQLAVFTDARELDAETMQALTREIGFSETTFVLPPEQGGHARVRIFNPQEEMRFAGHPTLGTAWVLAAPLQLGVVSLETGAGVVDVAVDRDPSGAIAFGRMRQPVPTIEEVPERDALFRALGVSGSLLPVEVYDNGATHIFVALESQDELMSLRPDLVGVASSGVTGVNCFAGSGSHWTLRMFWPHGEDAATGSAAGPLACHLCRHGLVAWGTEIEVSQGAAIGRPSMLHARAEGGAEGIELVEVGGRAVVVARGEFRI